jgi:hypothetical protein
LLDLTQTTPVCRIRVNPTFGRESDSPVARRVNRLAHIPRPIALHLLQKHSYIRQTFTRMHGAGVRNMPQPLHAAVAVAVVLFMVQSREGAWQNLLTFAGAPSWKNRTGIAEWPAGGGARSNVRCSRTR